MQSKTVLWIYLVLKSTNQRTQHPKIGIGHPTYQSPTESPSPPHYSVAKSINHSSKFNSAKTSTVVNMRKLKLLISVTCQRTSFSQSDGQYLLLALRMEVDPTHGSRNLIETYIVESLETRAHDLPNSMIWHQKVFFPPHEDILPLCAVLVAKIRFLRLLSQWPPRRESSPVLHICLVCCAP